MSMSTFRVEYKRLKNNIFVRGAAKRSITETVHNKLKHGAGLDSYKVYDLVEKLFDKPDLVSIHYIEEERIDEAEKDANLSADEKEVLKALRREIKAHGPFDLLMC